MSRTIEGVPEYVTATQVRKLCAALGIDATNLIQLRINRGGIIADIYATVSGGSRITDGEKAATHNLFIRLIGDDEEEAYKASRESRAAGEERAAQEEASGHCGSRSHGGLTCEEQPGHSGAHAARGGKVLWAEGDPT